MNEANPNKPLSTAVKVVIGLIVIVLAVLLLMGYSLTRLIRHTFTPIQQANDGLATQVSQLLHPTPTIIPDPVTIIHEVRSLARLETIQYSVEKVITAEQNQGLFGPLFGDKLLFVAHGYTIAGVDLAEMSSADLNLRDGILYVCLPKAEVFVATLNNDQSYVYDRTTGILTKGSPQLETAARQAAEEEILNAALNDGILKQAEMNAQVFLASWFKTMGYANVVFETDP